MSTEVSILCARIPDAPTSLANNSAVSNDVQIGLAWANGMSNGGASIINYQVSYDDGTNRWVTSSVMTQSFIASGLKPGTLYIFKVQSRNPVGLSMASSTIQILAARSPDAPVIQNTKQISVNIDLTWIDGVYNGGSSIIDYRISYDQGKGEFVVLADYVSMKSFTARGLVSGTIYIFEIQARNVKGYSAPSEPVAIVCPVLTILTSNTAPDTPNNLKARISSDTQISLTWVDGASDGGSPILDYEVSYDQGQNIWSVLKSSVFTKSYTANGLSLGKTYQFQVQSRNSVGQSVLSSAASILLARLPDAPTNFQASISSDGQISLAWADGEQNGGQPILDYQLSYDQGQNIWSVIQKNVVSKSYTAAGLSLGKTYQFKVQARNTIGLSVSSSELIILCARLPDAPIQLEATMISDGQISFRWADGVSDGGSPILDYQLSYDQGLNIWSVLTSSVFTKSQTADGLSLGKTYQFKVQSRNFVGLSVTSQTVSILLARPPDAPTNLHASISSDILIGLTWADGASNGGLPILDYQVSFDQGQNTWRVLPDTFKVQSFTATGLTPGKTYQFKVQARNAVGSSLKSSIFSVLAAKIPDPPVNIATTLIDVNVVGLTWTEGSYNGGSSVLDYTISYDQGTNSPMTLTSGVTGSSYTAMHLMAGVTYKFMVQARNQIGLSVFSSEAQVLCARVPDAPINLQNMVSVTSDVKIGLKWADGPSNGGSPILDYLVSWDLEGNYETLAITKSNTYTSLNLIPGRTYIFKLQSRNAAGYSDFSSGVEILAAKTPNAPLSLSSFFCFHQGTHISLKWSEGAYNGGSAVLDYSLYYDKGVGFVAMSSGIQETNFIAKGLTSNVSYKFKVQSRNIVGFSDFSVELAILCKPIPADSFGQPIQVNTKPDQEETTNNLVPIISGSVGGLVLVGVIVGVVVLKLRQKALSTELPISKKAYILGNEAHDELHNVNSGLKLVANSQEDFEAQVEIGAFQVEFEKSQNQSGQLDDTERHMVNQSEHFEHMNFIDLETSKKVSSKKSAHSSWSQLEQSIISASLEGQEFKRSDSGEEQKFEGRGAQYESYVYKENASEKSSIILSSKKADIAAVNNKIKIVKSVPSLKNSSKQEGKQSYQDKSQIQVKSRENSRASEDSIRDQIAQLEEEICELAPSTSQKSDESNYVTMIDPKSKSEHFAESEVAIEVKHATKVVDGSKQIQQQKKSENDLQQQEVVVRMDLAATNGIYDKMRDSSDAQLQQMATEFQILNRQMEPILNRVEEVVLDQGPEPIDTFQEKQNQVKTHQDAKELTTNCSVTPIRGSVAQHNPSEPTTQLIVREQQIMTNEFKTVKGKFFTQFAEPQQENQFDSEWTPRQFQSQECGINSSREKSIERLKEIDISPMQMATQSIQETHDYNQSMDIQQSYVKKEGQPNSQQFSLAAYSVASYNDRASIAEIVELSNGATLKNLNNSDGYAEDDTKISNLRSNEHRSNTGSRFAEIEQAPDDYLNQSPKNDFFNSTGRSFNEELRTLKKTKKQAEKDVRALEQQIIEDRNFKRRSTLVDVKKKKLENRQSDVRRQESLMVQKQQSNQWTPQKHNQNDSEISFQASHGFQSDVPMRMISGVFTNSMMQNNYTLNDYEPVQPFVTRTQLFDVDLDRTHVHKYQTANYLKKDFIDQEWVDTLQGREQKKKEQKQAIPMQKNNDWFQTTNKTLAMQLNYAMPDLLEEVKLGGLEATIKERSVSPLRSSILRAKSTIKVPSGFVRLQMLDPKMRVRENSTLDSPLPKLAKEARRLNSTALVKRASSNKR